jgi:hypothetical protein
MKDKFKITEVSPWTFKITESGAWRFLISEVGAWRFKLTEVDSDATAPTLVSAVMSDATTCVLTFSETLKVVTPSVLDYVFEDNTVTDAELSGATVTLTLGTAIEYGDTPSVFYIPGNLQDVWGNLVAGFTSDVDASILAQPPSPTSAAVGTVIGATGLKSWVITFDLDLGETMPSASAFAVSGFTFLSVTKTGSKEITVLSDDTAEWGESYSMAYTQPGSNELQGVTGEKVASFTQAVTNNCPTDFIFTVDTTIMGTGGSAADTFILPTTGSGYNCTINWGDEITTHSGTPGNISHTWATGGLKQIRVSGTFPRIYFINTGDKLKVISVDNWGNVSFTAFYGAFQGCNNLNTIDAGKMGVGSTSISWQHAFSSTTILFLPNFFKYAPDSTSLIQVCQNCPYLKTLHKDIFKYNTKVTTFAYFFYGCSGLESVPELIFSYHPLVTGTTVFSGFRNTFAGCNKLKLNRNIFYADGEQSTRFLNKTISFLTCFDRTGTYTSEIGEAPDLWNCDFGTGTPVTTDAFKGHSAASLSNYNDIPADWL